VTRPPGAPPRRSAGIVRTLKERGAWLKATEQLIDTSTAAGKAFFDILGVFAEFESAGHLYTGRKPTVPIEEVRRLHGEGKAPGAIAKALSVSRMTVCRVPKAG
jgi:DNA invertase Pin-like site-specific DNA recombinase